MPTVLPYVPQRITVHLGTPNSDAQNVTVSFSDYVKNVASSEIYPTWDESALRANILAITSFALNRVYTEFYRSRGYDYDITNSTAFDQYFVNGRSYFDNISQLVDELFNDYLRRPESVGQRKFGPAGTFLHGNSAKLLRRCRDRKQCPCTGNHHFLSGHTSSAGYLRPQRRDSTGGAEPNLSKLSCHTQNSTC